MSTQKKRGSNLFDPRPGRARPNVLRTGAIFCAISGIFLWIIYTKPTIIPSAGTNVKAHMASGANIRPGYTPVRVSGVEVGQVTKLERHDDRGVIVTMKVEDGKGVDLRQDASAHLRWRTLLGRNDYIDLIPGSKSAPELGDNTIPLRQDERADRARRGARGVRRRRPHRAQDDLRRVQRRLRRSRPGRAGYPGRRPVAAAGGSRPARAAGHRRRRPDDPRVARRAA